MVSKILHPKTMIDVTAGLIGIFFDRVSRGAPPGPVAGRGNDLTEVNGIGPTFARRLNEAGITDFSQLAQLSPEQARAITGAAKWQADPADWISQARHMSGTQAAVAA